MAGEIADVNILELFEASKTACLQNAIVTRHFVEQASNQFMIAIGVLIGIVILLIFYFRKQLKKELKKEIMFEFIKLLSDKKTKEDILKIDKSLLEIE